MNLSKLRRTLHRYPELSGDESGTAARIAKQLANLKPNRVWTGLGGHGVAAAFGDATTGPSVLVRAELDALAIHESNTLEHRSLIDGVAHKCGHDGHMAIVCGVAERFAQHPPTCGRVIVLFQPAEEDGTGARSVVQDSRFAELKPDWAFAMHNVPGASLGTVLLRTNTFACASRGLTIQLSGATSHAAHPEDGISPALAVSELLRQLSQLKPKAADGLAFATVIHATLGHPDFGIAPGDAKIMVTLRAESDALMHDLVQRVEHQVKCVAQLHGLTFSLSWSDVFGATRNHADAIAQVESAAGQLDMAIQRQSEPFRWSEDFGVFAHAAQIAMFGVGAGTSHPQLHTAEYDFPDQLIEPCVALFEHVVRRALS